MNRKFLDKPIIIAQNISKIYNDGNSELKILQDLNLTVHRGEKVAILGSSGSGKSTLLHILAGLDNPTTGTVIVGKNNLGDQNEDSRANLRNQNFGFIYQFHHLLPEFTAVENVAMPLLIRGEEFESSLHLAKKYLDKVELSSRYDHKPSELSGGERQRVAIARALITKPKCILADEPTGNLDEENARIVFELFLDLNANSNTSIILVTHDQTLAAQLDTIYYLNYGKLTEVES
ncbi:MAG: ABC transporter ATP-binding protein [Gammaproteobacteria bacterium]|nr:ABC transporter ATP-binding protein [Gammaproteobacteria bacterium]